MEQVIFDCDNTMGLLEKDVDDGLALLYLLGSQKINLLAVTTTFGNSSIKDVYSNTQRIFSELALDDLPLYKGAASSLNRVSEAAQALVRIVSENPGQITILATGSMTNLMGAYELDSEFFYKVKQIIMMGGIEKPLLVNGKVMNELNFSSDAEAIQTVLKHGKNLAIITGHICLDAVFSQGTYDDMVKILGKDIYNFIRKESKHWIDFIGGKYDMDGFCNWDAVAAVFIDHPQLFTTEVRYIGAELNDLKTGFLRENKTHGRPVEIAKKIKDLGAFNQILIEGWANIKTKA